MHLDEDLLRAMKVAAAREDKTEYQVVEVALRKHLGWDVLERIRAVRTLQKMKRWRSLLRRNARYERNLVVDTSRVRRSWTNFDD